MAEFLDEVMGNCFASGAPTAHENFAFGQLFWTHAYYPHGLLQLWRPADENRKMQIASNFNVTSGLPDAFNRTLPYSSPYLAIDEEFIVIRAKRRPVVMIQPPDASLTSIRGRDVRMKIARHLCVIAPLYSLEDDVGYSKAPQEFINRIRQLEYPQFLFLPKGGPLMRDSFLRVDELQSVTINNLEQTNYCLSADLKQVFRSQVSYYLTGLGDDDFNGYRALLKDEA
jgi:hypothetical protein